MFVETVTELVHGPEPGRIEKIVVVAGCNPDVVDAGRRGEWVFGDIEPPRFVGEPELVSHLEHCPFLHVDRKVAVNP